MDNPFLGTITMFGGNFAPVGWEFCNGQLMNISQNQALYAVIGKVYGGDGVSTFALPNLQSCVPIHQGQGSGLTARTLGQQVGTETVTLTTAQMPAHNHTVNVSTATATAKPPTNAYLAVSTDPDASGAPFNFIEPTAVNEAMASNSVSLAGGNQPHDNRQPYLATSFIIATVGLFPTQS